MMKIVIGNDHRGFDLKNYLIEKSSLDFIDIGSYSKERTDYPIYVKLACEKILAKEAQMGILICGSGAGMSIAANRFKDIYAALVWSQETAHLAKRDDNANVLILPADFISNEQALEMINIWISTEFSGGRYLERLKMIDEILGDL
jgi:ribose 5-phosphate isomerase B